MKKVLIRVSFACMALASFVVAILYVLVERRHQHLENREPFSIEKLERLVNAAPTTPDPTETETVPGASSPASSLPDHLEGIPSQEALTSKWVEPNATLSSMVGLGDIVKGLYLV